jgi:NADH-quinone oxidoreductase subunit G
MPDGVVWLPTNSPGSTLARTLGVTSGAIVTVTSSAVATTTLDTTMPQRPATSLDTTMPRPATSPDSDGGAQ